MAAHGQRWKNKWKKLPCFHNLLPLYVQKRPQGRCVSRVDERTGEGRFQSVSGVRASNTARPSSTALIEGKMGASKPCTCSAEAVCNVGNASDIAGAHDCEEHLPRDCWLGEAGTLCHLTTSAQRIGTGADQGRERQPFQCKLKGAATQRWRPRRLSLQRLACSLLPLGRCRTGVAGGRPDTLGLCLPRTKLAVLTDSRVS